MSKLWRVERYRFFKDCMIWIAVAVMLSVLLFLSTEDPEMLIGDNTLEGTITSTLKLANIFIALVVCVAVAVYIGREFKQKTICYEVMRGYGMWRIGFIKTLTCGFINAILLQLAIWIYVTSMDGKTNLFSFGRWCLMFLILCHICTCVTLYVILFRDGGIGGCLAFVRFTLFSVMGIFISEIILPDFAQDIYMAFSPMSQWNVVINVRDSIPMIYLVGVPVSFLLEYTLLLVMVQLVSKKKDF